MTDTTQDLQVVLNPQQMEAVEQTEGYVRVIAGAGSGKTRALAHRFAYLVNDIGIMPGSILCVTFTNKSANEMRQRIHDLTGDEDTGYISTFHGFCNTVLLEDSHAIHYPKSFLVLDNSDIDAFLKTIYEERGLTSRTMTFSKARDMFEMKKLKEIPDYYYDLVSLSLEQLKQKYDAATDPEDILFYGYLYHEKKNFALDYNDLIILTLYIFRENEEIANKWQERLEYIMIDEFQDIDELQYELMEVLASYHKNLFVVGDPDQTIYTWRGANVKFLLDFDQHFPGTKTIFLNQNYRSTPQILETANMLISKNKNRIEKNLFSENGSGLPVRAMHFENTAQEAQGIANLIDSLLHKGYEYKDIAILYRAHYMSRSLEDVFLEKGIPYTIYSGVQFFQRMEIKDAISYLRMLVYKSDLDFLRVVNNPKRNIGKTRLDFLSKYSLENHKTLYESLKDNLETDLFKKSQAASFVDLIENFQWQNRPASEVLSDILDQSGYEAMMRLQGSQERLDNLAELKQSAQEYELSAGEDVDIEAYLQHISLFTNADRDMRSQKVKLMTIHTAKGLEFPVVIIPGMNEGLFPSKKTRTPHAMEEERRLAFVAFTRAQKALYLTDAAGMSQAVGYRYPSRFLLEVKDSLVWDPRPDEDLLKRTSQIAGRMSQEQSASLEAGDRIRHKVFGEGVILESNPQQHCYLIHFDQLNTTRKLSWKASMEKIGKNALGEFLN